MARRLFSTTKTLFSRTQPIPTSNPETPSALPTSHSTAAAAAAASLLPLLPCKRRKKLLKKLNSPRAAPIQKEPILHNQQLDAILDRDAAFRFLNRTKSYLSSIPNHRLPLPVAGKLHRELGFPRGRKVSLFATRHPLLFHLPRIDSVPHLSFTPLMTSLLAEEQRILNDLLPLRITAIRKLLMLTARHRIPLAKLHHCRELFGLPDDFRHRVLEFPEYFRVAIDADDNNRRVLELVTWDPKLAVSAVERDFIADEARVRRTFRFSVPHRKAMRLDEEDAKLLDAATTFPLVSPYSDGSVHNPWTVEAEKYRVGVVHEFLSLTLEKRAWIHHIVEFKEELGLTRHMYQTLRKQTQAFYLGGTEMNWAVFLRDAYDEEGNLRQKDPQVLFNEKLQRYACKMEEMGASGVAGDG